MRTQVATAHRTVTCGCALARAGLTLLVMTPQESISDCFQQFALTQIDLATACLTDAKLNPDEAIHETRRCLKRVRAILRLVRAEVGEPIYDRDNRYFRDLGQRLAELRDATVVQETLASLQQKFTSALGTKTWQAIAKDLLGAPAKQGKKKVLKDVTAKLNLARVRVENWPFVFEEPTAWRKALRKTFRKGRRAMKQALSDPQATNFHEWRKQVNHLRHQLQILQNLKIGKVKATLQDFKTLAEILGRKNDLAVLSQHLQRIKRKAGEPARQALQELMHARNAAFAAEASQLGQQLYARKSKAFTKPIQL